MIYCRLRCLYCGLDHYTESEPNTWAAMRLLRGSADVGLRCQKCGQMDFKIIKTEKLDRSNQNDIFGYRFSPKFPSDIVLEEPAREDHLAESF